MAITILSYQPDLARSIAETGRRGSLLLLPLPLFWIKKYTTSAFAAQRQSFSLKNTLVVFVQACTGDGDNAQVIFFLFAHQLGWRP